MPLGRPRAPGTDVERAEARRAKVRVNVQAFRRRQREIKLKNAANANAASPTLMRSCRGDYDGLEWNGSVGSTTTSYLDVPYDNSSISSGNGSVRSARSSPSATAHDNYSRTPESDYADPDSWMWHLPQDLVTDVAYQDPQSLTIQSDFFPSPATIEANGDRCPNEVYRILKNSHVTWLHSGTVALGKQGAQIISDAFFASALTTTSRQRQDSEMGVHGAFIQSRALKNLRIALQKFAAGEQIWDPVALSLAALTCAMAELLASRSWDTFASHLGGVGSLIQYDGSQKLASAAARDHFYGYRALAAPFALAHGWETFLSEPEWINPPWKHEVELAGHPLHTMLDVAYRIVPEISAQNTPQVWDIVELGNRLRRLELIARELSDWERGLRASQRGHSLHQRKAAQWPGLYDYAFEFGNLSSAMAYAMYCGARVKLADTMLRVITAANEREPGMYIHGIDVLLEGLKWSRQALQSLEYFLTGKPKIVGRIPVLFPFECAWEYLSSGRLDAHVDVSNERRWCYGTAQRLAALDIPVFTWR